MKKIIFIYIIFFCNIIFNVSLAENYYEIAKINFDDKKYDKSKFLFQKNIVHNPKDSNSYLYLAKIFNYEKNLKEEEKNIKTTLLLNPNNEEAVYMLINIELKKSNYSEVKNLIDKFNIICTTICDKSKSLSENLKNIESKNES